MYNAFDCNFPLRQDTAMLAFASGMRYVGQYLSSNYKGLTVQAAAGIKVSGLKILSIYERDPVGAAYFTAANAACQLPLRKQSGL
jgi:pyruvate/2-oxoacid:ferredoxin oxidoreductase beta subunit